MLGHDTVCLTMALDSDADRISLLDRHGFTRSDGFDVLYSRSLKDPVSIPKLDSSLRLRNATDADLQSARGDPSRCMVGVGTFARDGGAYRRLRSSPVYDPELDIVLEDASGRFLSYCIGWLDIANRFGHFEPVGCRPDFTGRGYARAVTIEGLRRMQARGMHTASGRHCERERASAGSISVLRVCRSGSRVPLYEADLRPLRAGRQGSLPCTFRPPFNRKIRPGRYFALGQGKDKTCVHLRAGDLDERTISANSESRRSGCDSPMSQSDLHNHGWAGADPASVAAILGTKYAALDRRLASMDEMHAWAGNNFGSPDPKLRPRLFEVAFARAVWDGLVRYEIGDDVWASTLDGSAANVTSILKRAHERGAPQVEWIPQLGMSRHCRIEDIRRWMEPFLGLRFYRTLDLSGDEFAQPIENFKLLYRLAKENGLRLKAAMWAQVGRYRFGTAGESWELERDEVQHGIAASDSPAVMRFLAENRIRLNICPTSNPDARQSRAARIASPIRKLFDA